MKKGRAGEAGMKGFLAQHVEKLVLGLAVLIALFLVWRGFCNREGIEAARTPAALYDELTQTTTVMKKFSWQTDFEKGRDLDQEFVTRAAEALKRADVAKYSTNKMMRPPVGPPPQKRTDPELLAAHTLQVRPGYGPMEKARRLQDGRGPDEFMDVLEADEEGVAEPVNLEDRTIRIDPNRQSEGGGGMGTGQYEGIYFVAVTALVPFREQLKAYQSSLMHAPGYDPRRDTPRYVNWTLERTEATAGEAEPKWKVIASFAEQAMRDGRPGPGGDQDRFRPSNRSDDEALDPIFTHEVLTSAVPPLVVMRNESYLMVHDKIRELSELEQAKRKERESRAQGPGRGGPEFNQRTSRFEGSRDAGPDMGGPDGDLGSRGQWGRSDPNDVSGNLNPDEVPEFKMFRYVDRDVEPGKSYQYRLALVLEDPNNPSRGTPPPNSTLDPVVIQRVVTSRPPGRPAEGDERERMANPEERDGGPPDRSRRWRRGGWRLFGRTTAFSEESPVVQVRDGYELLAGVVTPTRVSLLRGTELALTKEEPSARLMVLEFDQKRARDIPCEFEVFRGSVANCTRTVEARIPGTQYLEELADHCFMSDALVLDIRGGSPADNEQLPEPGEILVWNSHGQFQVLNELEDAEEYERFVFEPAEEVTPRDAEGDARGDAGDMGDAARGRGDERRTNRRRASYRGDQ
jgi:hypothetical protein